MMDQFHNQRAVVMGLGRFGGGIGVIRALVETGADVLVTDSSDKETLAQSLQSLEDLESTSRLEFRFGPHENSMLEHADVLVVNPAVPTPWNNPFITHARSLGIRVTTEIELAYRQIPASNIIAVTGSAGKSTTSAMIHHACEQLNVPSVLMGNIGGSALQTLQSIEQPQETVFIIELSSAMLHWLWGNESQSPIVARPAVACITNCLPNHIDWHGTYEHYEQSKRLLIGQESSSSMVILGDSISDWKSIHKGESKIFTTADAITGCMVPGKHNAINAAMATEALHAFRTDIPRIRFAEAVKSFTGLPHRLHLCHQADDIDFYNDSKSTVPQATVLAAEAVSERTPMNAIHLICGGYDKGVDLTPIANIAHQLASVHTIGQVGEDLAKSCNGVYSQGLEAAIESVVKIARPGDAVLLSPGCASWDQFTNFEERGEAFVSLVQQAMQAKALQ